MHLIENNYLIECKSYNTGFHDLRKGNLDCHFRNLLSTHSPKPFRDYLSTIKSYYYKFGQNPSFFS